MKIIRWLLSHIFLILLIVVVIYGYMFWGNLAGENTPAGKALAYLSNEFDSVAEFVEAVKAKQSDIDDVNQNEQTAAQQHDGSEGAADIDTSAVSEPPSDDTPAALNVHQADATPAMANASDAASDADRNAAVPATRRNIDQQPVNISYRHNQVQVKQNSSGMIETAAVAAQDPAQSVAMTSRHSNDTADGRQSTVSTSANSSQISTSKFSSDKPDISDNFVSEDIENQLENVDDRGKVIDKALQNKNIKATWVAARKSFYRRDYLSSVKSYQKIINSTEDNFDAYGELGNVYFNQGKRQQAADAYYEAAAILVRMGQVNRARSLMGLMIHLDKEKADELKKLLDSAKS